MSNLKYDFPSFFARLVTFANVPCGNRTHNYSLGGYCYIHLTKRTYTVFEARAIGYGCHI